MSKNGLTYLTQKFVQKLQKLEIKSTIYPCKSPPTLMSNLTQKCNKKQFTKIFTAFKPFDLHITSYRMILQENSNLKICL